MTKLHKFDYSKERIPKIDKLELSKRMTLIFPCVVEENEIFLIKNIGNPINYSFSWDAKKGKNVGLISHDGLSKRDRPAENGGWYCKKVADKVGMFITLHNFGYYGFYKPSIEEVLAQLPAELFDEKKLSGRKLYFTNKMISDDVNTSLLDQEYHIAKTVVYIDVI